MTIFCEALIFLSLTLLAVIVAIFVVAVSFLGRAIEQSATQEEELAQLAKAELDKTIKNVTKKLNQARASDKGVDEVQKELEQYKEKEKKFKEDRAKASKRYKLLTAREGVLYPGAILLVAILFAGVGRALGSVSGTAAQVLSYVLPVLAAIEVIWVCYQAYRSLSVVQSVATLPEDVYLKRTVDAFRVALAEHEATRRPVLELIFKDRTPPLKFKASAEELIAVEIRLRQGDVARSSEWRLFAPKDFEFIEIKTIQRGEDTPLLPNYVEAIIDVGDIRRGLLRTTNASLKTPSTAGLYILGYSLLCDGFNSGVQQFEVEVV